MKIHPLFIGLLCSAVLALQAWTLNTVVELKTEVSALRATINLHINQQTTIAKK